MNPPDLTIDSVLHTSSDALLQAEMAAPGQLEGLQQAATIDVRKCMNAIKTVGSALSVIQNDENLNQAESFQSLLNEASRVSRIILIRWGRNPEDRANRWMLNVIEKSLMPFLSPHLPLSDEKINVLISTLQQRAVDFPESDAWQHDNMVSVSIFKGLSLLSKSQAEFDFGRSKTAEQDLETLRDLVLLHSLNTMSELCPNLTPDNDRITFLVMILDQAFYIMNVAWKKNAVKAGQALSKLSKEQLKAWRIAHPEGFALQPVIENFEQSIGRLLRLTVAARKQDKKRK